MLPIPTDSELVDAAKITAITSQEGDGGLV